MRAPLRITLRPARAYVFGRRLHHGPVGLLLTILGAGITATDWRDRRRWGPDFLKSPEER